MGKIKTAPQKSRHLNPIDLKSIGQEYRISGSLYSVSPFQKRGLWDIPADITKKEVAKLKRLIKWATK